MTNMKKKGILVIGGTGFLGYHLAKGAIKKKWDVYSFSRKAPPKKRILNKLKYIYGDTSKKKSFNKLLNKKFNYIINFSGYVDHKNKKKVYEGHFIGCKNIVDFFLKKNIEAFIQIGSCAEYGKMSSPQNEKAQCKPISHYGKAKNKSSNYLKKMYKKHQFPFTILRLYQVYGPKQDLNRLIPIVIDACKRKKNFPCSNGNQLRDFAHIEDIVSAIFKVLDIKKSRGKIINIGSGIPVKIKYVIDTIVSIIKNGKPEYGKIELRNDEIKTVYPNLYLAKSLLKWKTKIPLIKGLKKTIKTI